MSKVRLLHVDDEPFFLEALRAALEHMGYEVVSCGSAGQAWRLLREQSFDGIILDIGIPVRDMFSEAADEEEAGLSSGDKGILFLEKLRQEAPERSIPILCLTVNNKESIIDRIAKAGATYLQKGATSSEADFLSTFMEAVNRAFPRK